MNNNQKDSFGVLREKLMQEPSPGFDQKFFEKFNQEFDQASQRKWSLANLFSFKIAVPVGVAAMLALFSLYQRSFDQYDPMLENKFVIAEVVENQELYKNYELFEMLDDVELTEEDWDYLLSEEDEVAHLTVESGRKKL